MVKSFSKKTDMVYKNILLISVMLVFNSCKTKEVQTLKVENSNNPTFKYATWITANPSRSDTAYAKTFKKYKAHGIDAVLINTGADTDVLQRLTVLALREALEVHAWIFAMNRPGDSVALQHPEWYAVSREGKSCYDTRPYVPYYQWLCPTRKASSTHVLGLVEKLAKVDGITSVHLDYIRFPDIFLPIGLLPKYNLVQNEELARFDFCYCEVCMATFEKIHQKNPKEIENIALDIEWKQFRLNQIKKIVDKAYTIAHKYEKKLTAAVFPYPEMADHMVRQRWDKWHIDAVFPMVYHNFYKEELNWIGFATRQGLEDLEGKAVQLHSGIYLPSMSEEEVTTAIKLVKDSGASGISFFEGDAITNAQLKAIKASKR